MSEQWFMTEDEDGYHIQRKLEEGGVATVCTLPLVSNGLFNKRRAVLITAAPDTFERLRKWIREVCNGCLCPDKCDDCPYAKDCDYVDGLEKEMKK